MGDTTRMSWTDDRVATLTKLWADGLSASQIAAELGGVTRNAVIGKVHRLGLSGRAKPASSNPKRVKRARQPYTNKPRTSGRGVAVRDGPSPSVRAAIEDLEAPESKKLDLVDLTETTCKWPHGDPATDDFHFCGNTAKDGSPYCEYHCRMAYQVTVDRRRDKRAA